MTRWLALPERRPTTTILAIGLLFLLAYGASLIVLRKPDGRIVIGDAVHYYVYLRSATFDGDLNFRNEYVRLYGLKGGEEGTEWVYTPTATGHVRNMMAIGTPIVWAPLYLVAATLAAMTGAIGLSGTADGFGRLYQATAGFSGIVAATVGAWLAYRMTAAVFGVRTAIWATLTTWLASSAIYYSVISPTYSHAASMLAVGAFFAYWAATRHRQTPTRYAVVGALAGFAALVRWQDAVFLVVPFVDALLEMREERGRTPFPLRRFFARMIACGAAAVLMFLPQIAVWMRLYGQPFAMPQGEEWMQWHAPYLAHVLLSDWHGLFTWTPVVAVAVFGLAWLPRKDLRLALPVIAAFLVSWWANGSVIEWWAGEAYGARRFVSCFPVFVLGMAAVFDRLRARPVMVATLAVVFIALNVLLLFQYQLFMHGLRDLAPYPRGWYALAVARFVVPFEFIARYVF